MRIAFYAPLKSPRNPRPSGDRRIARLLIRALESSGHEIELMSEHRAWEGHGDTTRQREIRNQGEQIAERLIAALQARPEEQRPEAWFSYHLYHKAPDWIGPRVSTMLNIPYLVAEASYAAKQDNGPWSTGLQQVRLALAQAAAVICINPKDIPGLRQLPGCESKIHPIAPFTDHAEIPVIDRPFFRQRLAADYGLSENLPWLISIAMMREDAKLESYRLLAVSLAKVTGPCQLLLIGDGRAREQVEALFSDRLARVRFLGQKGQRETLELLQASDLFVWPAVNEAIGMAILEAQACGLPVVAGDSGAIPEIVTNGETGLLFTPGDTGGMAAAVERLISDNSLRKRFSKQARTNTGQRHSLSAAAVELDGIFSRL